MLPTHDVDCPACGKFLYTALSLEDFFPADAPTMPRVLTDGQGDYLPCPHCGARVEMKRVITSAGPGFRIAKSSGA
jgi:DNA-directed RNA polymerase subunit RPC12/RpoP